MYNSNGFNEVISSIAEAITSIVYEEDTEENETFNSDHIQSNQVDKNTLADTFQLFVTQHNLQEECYNIHHKLPSFIMPEFRILEEKFGVPQWNWWLNNCFIM